MLMQAFLSPLAAHQATLLIPSRSGFTRQVTSDEGRVAGGNLSSTRHLVELAIDLTLEELRHYGYLSLTFVCLQGHIPESMGTDTIRLC